MCGRSQWPRDLRRGFTAARLLGLRVRNTPGPSMSVSYKCCVLSGRGLCIGLITRPEESYRLWCVWVWSWSLDNEEALAHYGLLRCGKTSIIWSLVTSVGIVIRTWDIGIWCSVLLRDFSLLSIQTRSVSEQIVMYRRRSCAVKVPEFENGHSL
jgi:hypothetical protein